MDLRTVPAKLRERMIRNFSDPRLVKQMNDDFLHILIEDGPKLEPLREKLKEAERVCPRQAITIVEG